MLQHRVILDTDIGDNIDDAFALALLLRSPEVDLIDVVATSAQVAHRILLVQIELFAAGHDSLNIELETRLRLHSGCPKAMASRAAPSRTMTYPHVGVAHQPPWFEEQAARLRLTERWRGVSTIAEPVTSFGVGALVAAPKPSSLVAVGPLTTLASAAIATEALPAKLNIYAMIGDFGSDGSIETNARSDPEAAHLVFVSGLSINVIPWSIGRQITLNDTDLARLRAAAGRGDRLVALLMDWLEQFWRHFPDKTTMCDPAAVVALLRPEWFQWRRGRVSVELRDEALYGLTRFEPDESGPHRVAFDIEAAKAKEFMLARLCQGTEAP